MQWYLAVLKNYVGFSDCVCRKEYWTFILINAIVGTIINVIQLISGLELPLLSLIYLTAMITPVIVSCVRHLHDTDRSGTRALLYLAPITGWLVLFVLACLKGNSGSNRYGNDPKSGSNQS